MMFRASVNRSLLLLLLFALPMLTLSHAEAAESTKRAVEITFLKSKPGQRDNLRSFIVANWFAMDKIAKERGLIASFTVLDSGNDKGPWNLMVLTTYLDDKGYEGVAAAFERIRLAHTTVRIQGKTLEDLGVVVDSKKMLELPAIGTS